MSESGRRSGANLQRHGDLEIPEDLPFQRREWLAERVAWAVMALLIAAALLGFFGTGPLSRTTAGDEAGPLWLEYERFARLLAPAPLRVHVGHQELLASRRFTGEELCRIYNVPPPIIGELSHGTFTNSETLIRFFAQSTLSSWARKLESALERQVLSEAARARHEIEVDLSGLLRGDPETRWRATRSRSRPAL